MPYKNKDDKRANNRKNYNAEYKRANYLKRVYGITPEDFDRILEEQDGHCAICGVDECPSHREYLSVDHCHETGRVRGIICHHCNLILGYAKDDIERLRRAAEYLEAACLAGF